MPVMERGPVSKLKLALSECKATLGRKASTLGEFELEGLEVTDLDARREARPASPVALDNRGSIGPLASILGELNSEVTAV